MPKKEETSMLDKLVTIDGLSGSGKTSIGNELARLVDWVHIDSGLIMRACLWKKTAQVDGNLEFIVESNALKPFFSGVEISGILLSEKIALGVAEACSNPSKEFTNEANKLIRSQVTKYQNRGVILTGRDFGYTFSSALLRVYLSAPLEERASRKGVQHKQLGMRDRIDLDRNQSLFIQNDDKVVRIESSNHSVSRITMRLYEEMQKRIIKLDNIATDGDSDKQAGI